MSGGSYDYLGWADECQIINRKESIPKIADDLRVLGNAPDAALASINLYNGIQDYLRVVEGQIENIGAIWKAMELWQSGDISEEEFKKALEEWRSK
jgi:hypothetical protein